MLYAQCSAGNQVLAPVRTMLPSRGLPVVLEWWYPESTDYNEFARQSGEFCQVPFATNSLAF